MNSTPLFSADSRAETTLSRKIDQVINQSIDQQRLVGSVVLVAHHGQWIYQRAAGLADRELQRPMQLDTLFRLASVSKPLVSTVAMILVAQGKIALDEDIRRWLPDFQPRLANGQLPVISVRQLLSHTAGLGYRFFEADIDGPYAQAGVSDGMDSATISLTENLQRLARVPLSYAPGSAWGYSIAIDVLGALLEQVTQLPLPQLVQQLLTEPLGLHDTGFSTQDRERLATAYVSDQPAPHRLQEGEIVPVVEGTVGIEYSPARIFNSQAWPSAGAGMVSSASDILRFLEMLRCGGQPLLTPDWVNEMGRDQTGGFERPDAPGLGFGLGFSVLRDPAAAASPESIGTWRWGGAYGHAWFVDRSAGLSVVALTNTLYEGMSGRFVNDLRDAIYAGIAS